MTPTELRESIDDRVALVCTLYGEARGEAVGDIIAIGCSIRNRVLTDIGHDQKPDWWGEGYKGICLARWQYSCWWETNPNTMAVYALAQAFVKEDPIPDAALVAELGWTADGLIGGTVRDHVHGAEHYCTTALLATPDRPMWSVGKVPVAVAGHHSFFRLYS